MYRLLLLSLLCVMTYRAEGFVSPQSQQLISIQSMSRAPRGALNLDQQIAQEHLPPQDMSKDLNRREGEAWANTPLLLLASLSTVLKSSSRNGNPVMFASTLANPASQAPFRWALALGLIVMQSHGVAFFQVMAVVLQQLFTLYMTSLVAFPCITKSLSAGIIGISGDFMAQNLEHRLKHRKRLTGNSSHQSAFLYDSRRGKSIMMGGFFISGPLMHLGYNLFEQILPVQGTFAALTHLVADMLVLDSFFVASAFFNTGIMEGYDLRKHIIPQFRRDYASTLKASWATSIMLMPLGFLCFRFLPVALRTVAMNMTDVIWDAIVSFMTHRNRHLADRIG